MKQSVFGQRLEERGFLRKKTATKNVWVGVGLKLFANTRGGLATDDSYDDRPVSLKGGAHEAVAYDTWFLEQVQASIDDPRPSIAGELVEAKFAAKRDALRKQMGNTA
jgi:hypothetical protein